ncbi:MAG TPA: ABC transporter permease subunit, partial [Anaeromyxobacteraceae bacterium]|nr:ABC transporter permease subunit [Anaeromyxobacteraceae bacterium]
MRATLAIARKELEVTFSTPVAWVVLMVVAFFAAQFFNGALDAYRFLSARALTFQSPEAMAGLNLTDLVVARLFGSMGLFVIIVAPLLSMRLIADEKRTRTFELLLTSPIRPFAIVAGKYLAALVVLVAVLALVAIYPVVLELAGDGASGGAAVEWQTVGTGLLGLFLLGAMALSIGLFFSSLTESVIVAALLAEIVLLALWVVTLFGIGAEGPVRDLVVALSAS